MLHHGAAPAPDGSMRPVQECHPYKSFVAVAALACLVWSSACAGDDPADGAAGCTDKQIDRSATVQVQDAAGKPAAAVDLDVSLIAAGAGKEITFTIANVATALTARPLKVQSIALVETDASGAPVPAPAFACLGPGGVACDKATFPALVPPGFAAGCAPAGATGSTTVTVRYTKVGAPDLRKATLSIAFDGDVKLGSAPWTVAFATRVGTPKIDCGPPKTDFGKVGLADGATATVACTNSGKGDGYITDAKMLGSLPLSADVGGVKVAAGTSWPSGKVVKVGAGEALDIAVQFSKLATEAKAQAILRLQTTDVVKPTFDLQFDVNTTGPCLQLEPSGTLAWGTQPIGLPLAKELKLKSCGTEDLELRSIAIAGGADQGFAVDFGTSCFGGVAPTTAKPTVIPKGAACTVNLVYTAPKQGVTNKATVEITTSAGVQSVAVSGNGSTAVQCPKACMVIKKADGGSVVGEVIPQTALVFDGSCSLPGAALQPIAKYKWTAQQPAGSYAVFAPSDAAKVVQFKPNVAGKYQIRLDVADAIGTPGCNPSTYDLNVISDDKIHIELTWDTPGDPIKTDEGDVNGKLADGTYAGSDMDLHFAHPFALDDPGQKDYDKNGQPDPWYSPCFDCNLFTMQTKWGDPDSYDDDALLERDDRDGWGPENIGLHVPEAGKIYHIGAIYLSAWGFGKSTPTVSIYLDGKLAATKVGPVMDEKDAWCVATVSWQPNAIQPCKGADANGVLLTKKYPNPIGLKCK